MLLEFDFGVILERRKTDRNGLGMWEMENQGQVVLGGRQVMPGKREVG